jgi:propionyl-CoA synthetase
MGIQPLPIKPGSPTKPVPGWDVRILGDDGAELPANRDGAVTVKLPLPPGALPTLWQADDRYVETYLSAHQGYYLTGDGGHIDADGYLFIMGRTDDVINVSGHRLSTGAIEEVIASHPDVAECAVVGIRDELKGQVPLGFVVLKAGADRDPGELRAELVRLVRDQVGAVAAFKRVEIVARLPKTRSGKILRGTMRRLADAQEYTVPPTIDDPKILDEIIQTLAASSQRS